MKESDRTAQVRALWRRLETWAASHAPRMLQGLHGPGTEDDLRALEHTLALVLPPAFRTSVTCHNGEDDGDVSILANHGYLLSVDAILMHWKMGVELGTAWGTLGLEDLQAWKGWILDGLITVCGPVKPIHHSLRWVPIASMDAKVYLYLDFDPPAGGTPGQVIHVDVEGGQWQVLAASFLAFLQQYVDDLEQDKYRVDTEGWIVARQDNVPQQPAMLPAYLQEVVFEQPGTPPATIPDIASLAPGETVMLEGTMGYLQGNGSEILFTLETHDGREYSIWASARNTVGFLQIRVQQYARVVVTRHAGAIDSQLRPPARLAPVELCAVQYTMLR
jgi:cell wall assembly regulator SMI1